MSEASTPEVPEVSAPVAKPASKSEEAKAFAAVKAEAVKEGKAVMDLPNAVRVDH